VRDIDVLRRLRLARRGRSGRALGEHPCNSCRAPWSDLEAGRGRRLLEAIRQAGGTGAFSSLGAGNQQSFVPLQLG
jgi:hypothetical protein